MFRKTLLAAVFAFCLPTLAFAVVDINTATQAELESVKGLGPTKARAIIDYRTQHGPFKRVEDLAKVKGLGKASVAKISKDLTVGTPAAEAAAPAK